MSSPEALEKPQRFQTSADELRQVGVRPVTFVEAYKGAPAWEIGRPQPFVQELMARGELAGRVLDLGCGTGENALLLAASGRTVVGIDIVPEAVARAAQKAVERGVPVDFRWGDALALSDALKNAGGDGTAMPPFDAALDSGTFHVFSDEDRARYVHEVHSALRPGGRLYLACFSEAEDRPGGPRRVAQAELRASFADGWTVDAIVPIRYSVTIFDDGARAWLASFTRR
jgi:SAM-dependent methyltransferase